LGLTAAFAVSFFVSIFGIPRSECKISVGYTCGVVGCLVGGISGGFFLFEVANPASFSGGSGVVGFAYLVGFVAGSITGRRLKQWSARRATEGKDTQTATRRREHWVLKLLRGFAWFCGETRREEIELIIADLKRDVRQMKKERRSKAFMGKVLVWHGVWAVVAMLWDGLMRILAAVVPVGKIISKWKGL